MNTPTEPGFYWANVPLYGWEPVEVEQTTEGLRVWLLGRSESDDVHDFIEWGERIQREGEQ